MEKLAKYFSISTACICMAIANATWAYDGRVEIEGLIEDEDTCEVSVGDQNKIVELPSASVYELNKVGKTAGKTAFSITLSKCQVNDYNRVKIVWISLESPNLSNTVKTNPAKNVAIKITKPTNPSWFLYLGAPDNEKADDSGKDNIQPRFDYAAEYIATGKATAGNVQAAVSFTIKYE